jgi:hypothetical protein
LHLFAVPLRLVDRHRFLCLLTFTWHSEFRLPLKLLKIITGMYYTYISYQYLVLLFIQLENNIHILDFRV